MKRLIALFMILSILTLCVGLSACSSDSDDNSKSDDAAATNDSAASSSKTPTATEKSSETVAPSEEETTKSIKDRYNDFVDALEPYRIGLTILFDNLVSHIDLDAMHSTVTQEDDDSVALDATILFANDSAELTEDGKSDLKIFMDAYVETVFTEDNKKDIKTIVVEGHTDTNGTHEYNQTLSEKRANTVRDYCVELHPELEEYMVAKGYSYDRPILNEDGSVNMAASRRVVFSLETNEDE